MEDVQMVTLWLPVAKKAGDREVVLKVRKDCKYRGIEYKAEVALEYEPLKNPLDCVYRGVSYKQKGPGPWAFCGEE